MSCMPYILYILRTSANTLYIVQTNDLKKKLMTKKYYEHIEDVNKYFKGREEDLLIINIIAGEGWKKLCPFVGKKIPRIPFPKENVGKYKKQ